MALCLSVLFLFIFGAIELCRLQSLLHAAGNAAYEGARQGVVPGATAADVQAAAASYLTSIADAGVTVQVAPAVLTDTTEYVTVTVSIDCDQVVWSGSLFPGKTVTSACQLRTERYNPETESGTEYVEFGFPDDD